MLLEFLIRAIANLNAPSTDISAIVAFVTRYIDPIRGLLSDITLVTMVAQADEVNILLQTAYNRVRFDYASQGLTAPPFPYNYELFSSHPALLVIVRNPVMSQSATMLQGWRATSFLDHILQALRGAQNEEFEALAQELITQSSQLPNSLVLRGVRRGARLFPNDSCNNFAGLRNGSEVVMCDLILPSSAQERDEALQRLRLYAFSLRAHNDPTFLGVSSDAIHPLSLVFQGTTPGAVNLVV